MSFPSKFPDHDCKHCGITIKKNDPVHKIDATGTWCKNENCPNPPKKEEKTMDDMKIQVDSPFSEAEVIVRWAAGRAYKITYENVSDINKLTVQDKSALGQKEGMLTRLLTDTTIELMKHNGIKSEYKK